MKKVYLAVVALLLLLLTTTVVIWANPFSADAGGELEELDPGKSPVTVSDSTKGAPSTTRVPLAEGTKPAVVAGESQSKSKSQGLRGRLVTAAAKPAAHVAYWVDAEIDTLPETNELAQIHEDPKKPARTTADGGWQLDISQRGLLWFRVDEGLAVAYRIDRLGQRASLDLGIPERVDLVVECANRQPGSRWRILCYPKTGAQREEDRVIAPTTVARDHGGVDFVVQRLVDRYTTKAKETFSVVRGQSYRVYAEGESFSIPKGEDEHSLRAPARHRLEAGAPWATMLVEVVDSFGHAVTDGGKVVFGPMKETWRNDHRLADGRKLIGYVELEDKKEYGVWVLLDDGELFHRVVRIAGTDAQPPLRFVRGQGVRPLQLSLHGLKSASLGEMKRMALLCSDGKIRFGTGHLSFFLDYSSEAFGFQLETERLYRLINMPEGWRKLWVLYNDGTIAIVANSGRQQITANLERGARLAEVDLLSEYERLSFEKRARARFEVLLTADPELWVVLDDAVLDTEVVRRPIWHKWRPGALPCRMRILGGGRTEEIIKSR